MLLEQSQSHDTSMHSKAYTNGDDVQHVFANGRSHKQQHESGPQQQHHVNGQRIIAESVTVSQHAGNGGRVQYYHSQPAQRFFADIF